MSSSSPELKPTDPDPAPSPTEEESMPSQYIRGYPPADKHNCPLDDFPECNPRSSEQDGELEVDAVNDTSCDLVIDTPDTAGDDSLAENSIPWEVEDSLADLHLDNEKTNSETVPRPPSNEMNANGVLDLSQNHLFVWCTHCPALLLIEYPAQQKLTFLQPVPPTQPSSSMIATICRSCRRKGLGVKASLFLLPLAAYRVRGMMMYQNACRLSQQTVHICTTITEHLLCVSMDQISSAMTDDCSLFGVDFVSVNERQGDEVNFFTRCFSSNFL